VAYRERSYICEGRKVKLVLYTPQEIQPYVVRIVRSLPCTGDIHDASFSTGRIRIAIFEALVRAFLSLSRRAKRERIQF